MGFSPHILFIRYVKFHLPSVCNCPIDLSILLLNVFEVSAWSVRKILFQRENIIWVTCYLVLIRRIWISKWISKNFMKIRISFLLYTFTSELRVFTILFILWLWSEFIIANYKTRMLNSVPGFWSTRWSYFK